MIYFDNAATTKPFSSSLPEESGLYWNPASLHGGGFLAEKALEDARTRLAKYMGILPEELYFTCGGTVSDNLAIRGYLQGKKGGRIITSEYEHPAVYECFKSLENEFEVVYLKPENGIVSALAVEKALTEDTRLVSIMQVNNETGAVNPVAEISRMLRRKKIPFHTDAVQGFLKGGAFDYSCVDFASFSGHKNHAPKGIGGIYIKKGIRIRPLIVGGGQEKNIFSGTVNVPGAVAWADAADYLIENAEKDRQTVCRINAYLREQTTLLGGVVLSPEKASPYVLSVAFEGYIAENILHFLSERQMYVSTGSACSSKKSSRVLKACGLERYSKNTLRFSFSGENTLTEAELFCSALSEALRTLIKIK